MVIHLPLCKRTSTAEAILVHFYFRPNWSEVVLSVNCILHEIAESLHLSNRPRCQHRKSHGTDEESKHENDDTVSSVDEQQRYQAEDTKDRAEDTKYPSG